MSTRQAEGNTKPELEHIYTNGLKKQQMPKLMPVLRFHASLLLATGHTARSVLFQLIIINDAPSPQTCLWDQTQWEC
jgi:hypothetical protein